MIFVQVEEDSAFKLLSIPVDQPRMAHIVFHIVGSLVEWLKRQARDQHGLGSKPTRAIPLCPWERHFTAHSPAW